jgi:hypothetical protein
VHLKELCQDIFCGTLKPIEKVLDARQVAFAVKKFKSHRRVGGMVEILEAIKLQEQREQARITF